MSDTEPRPQEYDDSDAAAILGEPQAQDDHQSQAEGPEMVQTPQSYSSNEYSLSLRKQDAFRRNRRRYPQDPDEEQLHFWNHRDRKSTIRRPSGVVERPLTLEDAFLRNEEYLRQLSEQLCPSTTTTHDHDAAPAVQRHKRRAEDDTERPPEQADPQLRPGEGAEMFRDLAFKTPPGPGHGSLDQGAHHLQETVREEDGSYLQIWKHIKDQSQDGLKLLQPKSGSHKTPLDSSLDRRSRSIISQSIHSLSYNSEYEEEEVRQRSVPAMAASFLPKELLNIGQLDRYAPSPMVSGTHSLLSRTWNQGRPCFTGNKMPGLYSYQPSHRYKPYSTFTYDKPVLPRHIRLIRFIKNPVPALKTGFIELFEVSLDEAPAYEALSHRWSTGQPSRSINCNGKSLTITLNLHEALMRLNILDRLLWVDAICINQDDVVEKGEQVAMMSGYTARRSVSWCGSGKVKIRTRCTSHIWS